MKPGAKHTPEARQRMREATRCAMADPAVRAKISARTRAAMADPAVRQRIRAGMVRAYGVAPDRAAIERELHTLKEAWRLAGASARGEFLAGILVPLTGEAVQR